MGNLFAKLVQIAQAPWFLFDAANAMKIGPFVLGPSADLDVLSRGLSIADGRSYKVHAIFKGAPVAVLRADNVDAVARPLEEFKASLWLSEASQRPKTTARQGREKGARGRRSILFMHNCYYNFYYLAAALRKRGWDAVSVSIEDPNGDHAQFYHGEDLNLFDPDPEKFRQNLQRFFVEAESRFRMIHFYGVGRMSIFPEYIDTRRSFDGLPVDFLRLRQQGVKIGYTVSGCLDGVAQSSINRWSGACERCVWQLHPNVCADDANLAWGRKVHTMCDLVETGGAPALDWKGRQDKVCREPLTMALDPDFWRIDLEIPEKYRLKRAPGELIVYHSVGNYQLRAQNSRNIKGTGAILAAIDRLKSEGFPVRLEFVTDVPSKDVRFIQLQADILVDQLNYGRYGAQACESMMLGRPTICYINKDEPEGIRGVDFVEECPIISATEQTIYAVLKDLLMDEGKRRELSRLSREFALKWHSADACAERFEAVYDRIMSGLPPSDPADWTNA